MVPLVAARIVTEPLGVSRSLPPLLFPEFAHLWLREDEGGLLFGASFEARPRYDLVQGSPPERYEQLPLDALVATEATAARASGAVPLLARYRSRTLAYGAPCYTPDLRALVGPAGGLDGLFVVGGCNEAGITHGPGYGRLVAEIVTGAAETIADPGPFSPDRFGRALPDGAAVVRAMRERGRLSWVEVSES